MNKLSEKQYYLIQSFVDGESSFMDSMRVKALVLVNRQAKSALDEMLGFKLRLQNQLSADFFEAPDLWSRIEARIDQEEKASIFLGQRSYQEHEGHTDRRWWIFPSGVLAGATCALFIVSFFGLPANSGLNPNSFVQNLGANTVPLVANRTSVASGQAVFDVASKQSKVVAPVVAVELDDIEVDWMRSAGRLRIVPNSNRQVAAIIVQRPPRLGTNSSVATQIPQGIAVNNVVR